METTDADDDEDDDDGGGDNSGGWSWLFGKQIYQQHQ